MLLDMQNTCIAVVWTTMAAFRGKRSKRDFGRIKDHSRTLFVVDVGPVFFVILLFQSLHLGMTATPIPKNNNEKQQSNSPPANPVSVIQEAEIADIADVSHVRPYQ
jgi:hypothetical protein